MTHNYFAIERSGQCADHVHIKFDDNTIAFEDIMDMSYDEIKSYHNIDEFVVATMDAANEYFGGAKDETTIINLISDDDIFVWGILIGPSDVQDDLRYSFVDWTKDGKSYKYEKD